MRMDGAKVKGEARLQDGGRSEKFGGRIGKQGKCVRVGKCGWGKCGWRNIERQSGVYGGEGKGRC